MSRRSDSQLVGLEDKAERKKSANLTSLKLLFSFAFPYWKVIIGAFLALIAAAVGTLSIGRVIQLFIDRGFDNNSEGLTEIFLLSYLVVGIIAIATFAA